MGNGIKATKKQSILDTLRTLLWRRPQSRQSMIIVRQEWKDEVSIVRNSAVQILHARTSEKSHLILVLIRMRLVLKVLDEVGQ